MKRIVCLFILLATGSGAVPVRAADYGGVPRERWLSMLDSEDPVFRLAAIAVLARQDPDGVVLPALGRASADTENEVGRAAVRALASMGEAASPYLIRALESEEESTARGTAMALAMHGDEGVPPLLDALGSEREVTRWAASSALVNVRYGDSGMDDLVEAVLSEGDRNPSALYVVNQLGPRAFPALDRFIDALDSAEASRRRRAVLAIGAMGTPDPAARAALERAGGDPDPEVAKSARFALTRLPR